MLYRETAQGLIAITQPAHAWISGQLARAWGNEQFGVVEPWEEVCLGAEQHDIGHIQWEQAPVLNLQTGLPYNFMEMPRQEHLKIWSSAARLALPQGRYPALLVSLHGTGLYQNADLSQESAENRQAIKDYLAHEHAFQQELLTSLRHDPRYRPYATDEAIALNQRLLQVWDWLSLLICFGRQQFPPIQQVPTANGTTTLILTSPQGDPSQLQITPWPFRQQQVTLVYEGRYLTTTYTDEATMRAALHHATWITLTTTLYPTGSV